jgi:NADH:ubiquinone oxidoreductase subunit E
MIDKVHSNCNKNNILKQFPEKRKKLDEYLKSLTVTHKLNYNQGHLIGCLHKAQSIFEYLPKELQEYIADKLRLSLSDVHGVTSFYSFFRTTPPGKYKISICMGTACFVKGADKILKKFEELLYIKDGETTKDRKFSLCALRCVGACSLAPVVLINETVHPNVKLKDISDIIKKLK